MKGSLCIAAISALVLSACSTIGLDGGSARAVPCQLANQHCVMVTIHQEAGGAWKIDVDNREVHVRGQQRLIFWRIHNQGAQRYQFPDDGIAFKTDPGRNEFRCQKTGNTDFMCVDTGATKGRFEYAIKVTGSPAVLPWDPFVVND